jgi:hypothetical protein
VDERAPWQQGPNESDDDYAAFLDFVAHPKASVADFARAAGLNPATTAQRAWRGRWRDRRAAYRNHLVGYKLAAAERAAGDEGAKLGALVSAVGDVLLRSVQAYAAAGQILDPKLWAAIATWHAAQTRLQEGKSTAAVEIVGATQADRLRAVLAAIEAPIEEDEDPETEGEPGT